MSQVKSKQRVEDHGEVFTAEREVNAMLDLVKQETERIDSRFLEPACGTGNFLIEILRRKMEVVERNYRSSQADFEKYSIIGVGSLYGIDLLPDNVEECQERLFNEYERTYSNIFKKTANPLFLDNIRFILRRNIVCGDALTMLDPDGSPIIFSEWSSLKYNIKRRDFSFKDIVRTSSKQTSIFDAGWTSEKKKAEFVPNPEKEYEFRHYLELIKDE